MSDVQVETTAGIVQGAVRDGLCVFRGIPYGAPTGGARRFLPPEPPAPWTGVLETTRWGHMSPQSESGGYRIDSGEDCLVLNVATPAVDDARRPVLVRFHGGGYSAGSGGGPFYDGRALARRGDAVVVTLNHRLNVFGFLHLGEIFGDEYASSGNAGLLDLVAALEWVRDNIARFGGDPDNVTTFGESGGGMKCSALLAFPAARGLFRRTCVQSGVSLRVTERADATAAAERLLAALEVGPRDLRKLQTLPVDAILAAARELGPRVGAAFQPVVDGVTMPRQPEAAIAAGVSNNVPVIVGATRNEFVVEESADLDEAAVNARLETIVGEIAGRLGVPQDDVGALAREVGAEYRRLRPTMTPAQLLTAVGADSRFRIPGIRLAEARLEAGASPTYQYLFTWSDPRRPGVAAHGSDIVFWADNLHALYGSPGHLPPEAGPERTPPPASARPLADAMSEALLAFARTDNPNHAGLPSWSPYTLERRETMVFGDRCHMEDDPLGDTRELWSARRLAAGRTQ